MYATLFKPRILVPSYQSSLNLICTQVPKYPENLTLVPGKVASTVIMSPLCHLNWREGRSRAPERIFVGNFIKSVNKLSRRVSSFLDTWILELEIVKRATKWILMSRTQLPRTQSVRYPLPDPVQNEAGGKCSGRGRNDRRGKLNARQV